MIKKHEDYRGTLSYVCTWRRFLSYNSGRTKPLFIVGLTASYLAPSCCTTPPPAMHYFPTTPSPQLRAGKGAVVSTWKAKSGAKPKVDVVLLYSEGGAGWALSAPEMQLPSCRRSPMLWGVCAKPEGAINATCSGKRPLKVIKKKKKSFEKWPIFQFGEITFCI